MRSRFDEQLKLLNRKMTEMGGECESIIAAAGKALLQGSAEDARRAQEQGHRIDQLEREIESICLKLLLQQQPVARDLRVISAALKMITDMERIGDQAEDIAEIITTLGGRTGAECRDIRVHGGGHHQNGHRQRGCLCAAGSELGPGGDRVR